MSHITYIHESCHILNESSYIYECVMSRIWMSQRAAKEISLKLWKPLSTRLGDPIHLEGLSFRDSWKPLRAENGGLWILKKTVNIFCTTIGFASFDGPLMFWFLVFLLAGGVFHVFKKWKCHHKSDIISGSFSLKHQNLWGAFVNPEIKAS